MSLSDELYERFGKRLEVEHWGEYLAVARDGRTVMGPDQIVVAQEAKEVLGPGVFLFKIGPKALGKWR